MSTILLASSPTALPIGNHEKVILNVGGVRHEVMWQTLNRLPRSRLGRLRHTIPDEAVGRRLCDTYDSTANEYYFDRQPTIFAAVLDFYRTGKLHLQDGHCVAAVGAELDYWGVCESHIDQCCRHRYDHKKEKLDEQMQIEAELLAAREQRSLKVKGGDGRCVDYRHRLWQLLERPQSSWLGRLFAAVTILYIILSTVVVIVSSMDNNYNNNNPSGQLSSTRREIEDSPVLSLLELICIVWFTLECVLRFVATPGNKWSYFRRWLNIIDLCAVLPYYVNLALVQTRLEAQHLYVARQMFVTLRTLRVLKLSRHIPGLKSMGYAVRHSYRELIQVTLFFTIAVIVFSSLVYFAERDVHETTFSSIPRTFWWAAITMTTVGYGDMVPATPYGKLVGVVCSMCGLVVIALPIPVLVTKFQQYYKNEMRRQNALLHCQREMATAAGVGTDSTPTNPSISSSDADDEPIELTHVLANTADDRIIVGGNSLIDSGLLSDKSID